MYLRPGSLGPSIKRGSGDLFWALSGINAKYTHQEYDIDETVIVGCKLWNVGC